jgi:hypothetical protein
MNVPTTLVMKRINPYLTFGISIQFVGILVEIHPLLKSSYCFKIVSDSNRNTLICLYYYRIDIINKNENLF